MNTIKIIKSNKKSISITVTKNAEVIVRAPFLMPDKNIMNFIEEHQNWINKKTNLITQINQKNREFIEFKKILILGNIYEIYYVKGLKDISFSDALYVPEKYRKSITKHLKSFLVGEFDKYIFNRIKTISSKIGFSFNNVTIINSKRKWGMCDAKKDLFFNCKMVMLKYELIDYIIIHELCHLRELNHSQNFWKLVETFMPDYKVRYEELKKCGFILNLF